VTRGGRAFQAEGRVMQKARWANKLGAFLGGRGEGGCGPESQAEGWMLRAWARA
jgi:hypothetical protein